MLRSTEQGQSGRRQKCLLFSYRTRIFRGLVYGNCAETMAGFPRFKRDLCSLLAPFGGVKMPVSAEKEECRIVKKKGNKLI